MRILPLIFIFLLFDLQVGISQTIDKIVFENRDSTNGYYLAIRPQSNNIKGVLVLLSSFNNVENILPETKLHNVAYVNDLLTIGVSMNEKIYADEPTVSRLNAVLANVVKKFGVDTSTFVLAGYDFAGNIALRYTELTNEKPAGFLIHPKAVLAIDSPVDLFGLWHWCERIIKKNYYPGNVGDAKYLLNLMTKEHGTIYSNPDTYKKLSPFSKEGQGTGNEQYLKNIPVRLYYDTDIEWQLSNRRNSFYDTNIPDGSELVNQLLLLGNNNAAFVTAKQPGRRSNGARNPNALSIVDEVECIQWIKKQLDIFDHNTYVPAYELDIPAGWGIERFAFPVEFAPTIPYGGVEDLRFAPGWGDTLSEEHWTYAFLWWLKGNPAIDAAGLQENLKAYYTGLVGRNIIARNIPANKVVPVSAMIKKVKTVSNDRDTYGGTISMLNYMTQLPIVLNCVVHVKNCIAQKHTAVFIEISPRPFSHITWQKLNKIAENFDCKD